MYAIDGEESPDECLSLILFVEPKIGTNSKEGRFTEESSDGGKQNTNHQVGMLN